MKKLQDTAALFEVSFPDYKQLRQCRSDIILVKAVWDMVVFVKVLDGLTKTDTFSYPNPHPTKKSAFNCLLCTRLV